MYKRAIPTIEKRMPKISVLNLLDDGSIFPPVFNLLSQLNQEIFFSRLEFWKEETFGLD